MSVRQGGPVSLSEHELSEIRMLIEERTSIRFDESRERFFSTRAREQMSNKGYTRGTDLLRAIKMIMSFRNCWKHCYEERHFSAIASSKI